MQPQHTHAIEQAGACLLEFAVMLAKYRAELEANGFSREEALAIVLQYQRDVLAPRPA